ncbi:sensor domain-containing diguanylate cyclase [Desulfobulbus alkaliphilus]|uniref:sensor domain-containing diguanylate cyclase n=1 Tax=Desulfobulbus alkaliphilus TaxID=869814 RepID=UPI00196593E1|nr:GGDEF domain-containing protein [Desulfobulbus alkaliphilus]MBM9536441.1 GGDEF domain-containing protein [Desulfobulbus alkaliphilus]
MTTDPDKVLESVLLSKDLPTLPIIASQLLTLTASDETTLTDIATLVSQDMALSAKVLRVANSSFYSFPQQISSINQAVSILGINAVRSLVLSFSFLALESRKQSDLFDFHRFWEHALVGAVAAKLIVEQVGGRDSEEAFICGLLQNIGQLVFAATMNKQYEEVLNQVHAKETNNDVSGSHDEDIESAVIGCTHSEIGFAAAKSWGLPESLLLPIQYHHQPDTYQGPEQYRKNVFAGYLADLLVKIFHSNDPAKYHKQFRTEARRLLGLKVLEVNNILRQIDRTIEQSAHYFGIKIGPVRSVAEILQEANLRLSLINLSYEEMNRELIKSKMELEKLSEELAQKNRLLENLANIDGLTEISNHRFFQNFLDAELNRSARHDDTLSLLLADIDHFKRFNDTFGHQTGDFLLKEFCRVAREQIREYDLIARYGGEEFVFILPQTGHEEAVLVAEKIRKKIEEYVFDDGRDTYSITISIGIACLRPALENTTKNELIGLADQALYSAKKEGRNRVKLYQPEKKKKWFSLS